MSDTDETPPTGFGLAPIRAEGAVIGPDDPEHYYGLRPPAMDRIERAARAYCIAMGIDPDHPCVGIGSLMPEGWLGPAWQVQVAGMEAALAAADAQIAPVESGW